MAEYDLTARAIVRSGPAYDLRAELARRLKAIGALPPLLPLIRRPDAMRAARPLWQAQWWPWDADDYALEAPERIPAGSCVDDGLPEQSAARRG